EGDRAKTLTVRDERENRGTAVLTADLDVTAVEVELRASVHHRLHVVHDPARDALTAVKAPAPDRFDVLAFRVTGNEQRGLYFEQVNCSAVEGDEVAQPAHDHGKDVL